MFKGIVEVCGFVAFFLYGVAIMVNNIGFIFNQINPIIFAYIAIGCTVVSILLALITLLIIMYRIYQRDNALIETQSLLYTDGDHNIVN